MQKKILLINALPAITIAGSIKQQADMSPALLYIGSWVTKRSNFDVKLIDCSVEKDYLKVIKQEIEGVFLVGLSVMTSSIPNALEITREIKKLDKGIKIIWGGIHPRLYPEQTIKCSLIDFIAYGEGEKPLLDLANSLINKTSLKKVKGIMYKSNGKIIKTPDAGYIDLNEIGVLNYALLDKGVFEDKIATIYTSRGCIFNCTFCLNTAIGHRWRAMNAENVIKEIEFLHKTYDIKVIHFSDENFFLNKDRAEKIVDLIIEKNFNIKFSGTVRANYFTNGFITKELLKKMKKAGFFRVFLGAEFGTQKMLDFVKKDITENDIYTAGRMLKEVDITVTYCFMTAFPTETKKDTIATAKMAEKLYKMNKGLIVFKEDNKITAWNEKSRMNIETYRPYVGGELYNYIIKEYGWNSPTTIEDWEKYFIKNKEIIPDDFPWLELKPEYYKALHLYVKSGKLDFPTFLRRILMPYNIKLKMASIIFYPFAKIRMTLSCFDFPFEYIIGKRLGVLKHFD